MVNMLYDQTFINHIQKTDLSDESKEGIIKKFKIKQYEEFVTKLKGDIKEKENQLEKVMKDYQ